MKTNQVLIKNRYQYSPNHPSYQTQLYSSYKAYDTQQKKYLILQIHKKQTSKLIQKLKGIKHIFIQEVIDVIQLKSQNKFAILLEGGIYANLSEILQKNHYLMENDGLVICKYLILALTDLHQEKAIHGRICLQNVLICENSLIKLGWMIVHSRQIPLLFKPPQLISKKQIYNSSDIYSLGVLLYKILYGIFPYQGNNQHQLLKNIKNQNIKSPSPSNYLLNIRVSTKLQQLLLKMLHYTPQNRPTLKQLTSFPLLAIPIQTNPLTFNHQKTNILPSTLTSQYQLIPYTKTIHKYDNYYEQTSYLALKIKQKQFVNIFIPDIKSLQIQSRKLQSYSQKLNTIQINSSSHHFISQIYYSFIFQKQPIIIMQYYNQGNLYQYLQQHLQSNQWITQQQIQTIMYLLTISYKNFAQLQLLPMHTVHSKRIMIKDGIIKLRQPALLTPFIQQHLIQQNKIDYFAPQLKLSSDFVDLDNTDMWSFGMIYYHLLTKSLQSIDSIQNINIQILQTSKKNKNIIKKCFDLTGNNRPKIDQINIDKLTKQNILAIQQQIKNINNINNQQKSHLKPQQKSIINQNKQQTTNQPLNNFDNYNHLLSYSPTYQWRIGIKIILGLLLIWLVFFGKFILNGGIGMLKTNYYRKVKLQVPYNHDTALKNITILTTDGTPFGTIYDYYSYQQIIYHLNCTENIHSSFAVGELYKYINNNHPTQCFFGFIYIILFSICYITIEVKSDLPTILTKKKQKKYYAILMHIILFFVQSALLFCFFTIFALQYLIQTTPCLGISNRAYPKFTAIQTLFNDNTGDFFKSIFPTVILWSLLMYIFSFLWLFNGRIKKSFQKINFILPIIIIMIIQTLVCRIGFGVSIPLQPTWSYKINTDITKQYWGLFGLFPQIFMLLIIIMDRLIDLLFWFLINKQQKINNKQKKITLKQNIKQIHLTTQDVSFGNLKLNQSHHKFMNSN